MTRAKADVIATNADRSALISGSKNSGSLTSAVLGSMAEHDVLGAKTLQRGIQKGRKWVSDADTYLGSMAAGSKWKDPNHKGMRKTLFTDSKDTMIKAEGGDNLYRKVTLPSITAPIKEFGLVAVPMWAMDSGMKTMSKLRGKQDPNSTPDPQQNQQSQQNHQFQPGNINNYGQ